MRTKTKTQNASKRILSVTIRRMVDESPDTSWLGEYANRSTSEYSIDRAHSEDCASVREDIKQVKQTLEHVQQTIGDLHNAVLAQYNGTLANAKLDAEKDALDEAYDMVGELIDSIDECDCGESGDMERNEYRYFNPSFNYVDKSGRALPENTPDEVRKYVKQDYERMESLNRGNWCLIGIRAEAEIGIPSTSRYIVLPNIDIRTGKASPRDYLLQTITSGGLWGIESDSDKSYLESVEKEELADLRAQLKALGFSARAISTAFKPENITEKSD